MTPAAGTAGVHVVSGKAPSEGMVMHCVPPGSENWSAEHCVQETGALLDQAPLAPRVTSTVAPTKPALQEYVKVVVLAGAVLGSGESVALPKAGMGGRKSASASAAERDLLKTRTSAMAPETSSAAPMAPPMPSTGAAPSAVFGTMAALEATSAPST